MLNRRGIASLCALVLIVATLAAACGPSGGDASPVEEVAPTAVPAKTEPPPTATPEPSPEPTAEPTATEVSGPTAEEYAAEADAFLTSLADQRRFSGAVLVARDGEVLFSKGYGLADREQEIPITPQTRFRLAAVNSQFNAMGILILQHLGKLDVSDPICTYLPDCPAVWEDITIHHLLSKSSGIPGYMEFVGHSPRLKTPQPPQDVMARVSAEPLRYQPGEMIEFSSLGVEDYLLATIIAQASGVPYQEFLAESIFTPLGMTDTVHVSSAGDSALGYESSSPHRPPSGPFAVEHGVMAHYSSVEDLLRWDRALYTDQLVPLESLDEMFADRGAYSAPVYSDNQITTAAESAAYYGRTGAAYDWMIGEQFGHSDLQAWGNAPGFWDYVDRYPNDRATIIVLLNQVDTDPTAVGTKLAQILFAEE